jgi:hypothetical protein
MKTRNEAMLNLGRIFPVHYTVGNVKKLHRCYVTKVDTFDGTLHYGFQTWDSPIISGWIPVAFVPDCEFRDLNPGTPGERVSAYHNAQVNEIRRRQ